MFFLLPLQEQISIPEIMVTAIGASAAMLTTSSFLPQIIKAYRTKSMDDVSHYLMSFFAAGTVLWMFYGVFKSDPVIIAANATASAFNFILLYMKFVYCKKHAKLG